MVFCHLNSNVFYLNILCSRNLGNYCIIVLTFNSITITTTLRNFDEKYIVFIFVYAIVWKFLASLLFC